MDIAMVYSDRLLSPQIPPARKLRVLKEVKIKLVEREEQDVDEFVLQVHSAEYLSRIRNHPFFDNAVENVKCILTGVKALQYYDAVIVPVTTAGHLAEQSRMRGYCLLNGLAMAVKAAESFGRIAVIETDAHHGKASIVSEERATLFCIGKRECEISEDLRCLLGRKIGKDYVKSFEELVERVKEYNPNLVIWYLGLDLDSREYAEMPIGREEWERLVEAFMRLAEGRKSLIMLASGLREDVLAEVMENILVRV
jgi:acetoin utilization deacetylase AcuC-like enzyme